MVLIWVLRIMSGLHAILKKERKNFIQEFFVGYNFN